MDGVLVAVNASRKVVTVSVAGAKSEVNLTEAAIDGGDERPLTWAILTSLVGQDIRIEGAYLKDGHLYASKAHIDVEFKRAEDQSHSRTPDNQQGDETPQKGESWDR